MCRRFARKERADLGGLRENCVVERSPAREIEPPLPLENELATALEAQRIPERALRQASHRGEASARTHVVERGLCRFTRRSSPLVHGFGVDQQHVRIPLDNPVVVLLYP